MGNQIGEAIHGELVNDGNSSTLAVLVLYTSGSATVRALKTGEFLNITDVHITTEDGGDTLLVAAEIDTAGLRIVQANFTANGGVDKHFSSPFVCPNGVTPYFQSAAANLNVCIIEGFITKI